MQTTHDKVATAACASSTAAKPSFLRMGKVGDKSGQQWGGRATLHLLRGGDAPAVLLLLPFTEFCLLWRFCMMMT